MAKPRNRRQSLDEDTLDLRLQEKIFLSTFVLMLLFLVSLYFPVPSIIPIILAVVLVAVTFFFYRKYREFYRLRDRGQRTWCVTISMYVSLVLTILCAYYFAKDTSLPWDYALVFLFGFMFFTYMVYQTLSTTMVVGNRRKRIKR